MTAAELIKSASRYGYTVVLKDGVAALKKTRKGPQLPEDIIAGFREHRDEILAFLTGQGSLPKVSACAICRATVTVEQMEAMTPGLWLSVCGLAGMRSSKKELVTHACPWKPKEDSNG